MERIEATIGKAHLDGGDSDSLSANIWQDMQSNAMRGKSDTGSLGGNAGVSAPPEGISPQSSAGDTGNQKVLETANKFSSNKADLSAENYKTVAKDNAQNMIPERNAAPNNAAADQGARVEKPADNLVFTPLYQAPKS